MVGQNRQKIITMTKLALYDKHEGAADRAANDYFRHDYIYRKNLGTRISVGIGGIVILALYWLRVVIIEGRDIFELDIQHHVRESVVFIVAIAAMYSLIGTIQGTREYYLVQRRLQQYQGMLRFLENTERARKPEEEQPEEKKPRTRAEELREKREQREKQREQRSRELREREREFNSRTPVYTPPSTTRDTREREAPDPLANVSARALSGSRPRRPVPLTQLPPPRVRYSTNPKDSPLLRTPPPSDKSEEA